MSPKRISPAAGSSGINKGQASDSSKERPMSDADTNVVDADAENLNQEVSNNSVSATSQQSSQLIIPAVRTAANFRPPQRICMLNHHLGNRVIGLGNTSGSGQQQQQTGGAQASGAFTFPQTNFLRIPKNALGKNLVNFKQVQQTPALTAGGSAGSSSSSSSAAVPNFTWATGRNLGGAPVAITNGSSSAIKNPKAVVQQPNLMMTNNSDDNSSEWGTASAGSSQACAATVSNQGPNILSSSQNLQIQGQSQSTSSVLKKKTSKNSSINLAGSSSSTSLANRLLEPSSNCSSAAHSNLQNNNNNSQQNNNFNNNSYFNSKKVAEDLLGTSDVSAFARHAHSSGSWNSLSRGQHDGSSTNLLSLQQQNQQNQNLSKASSNQKVSSEHNQIHSSTSASWLWYLISLYFDVRTLGRFLTAFPHLLSYEEESSVWQHLAYLFHLIVPVERDCWLPNKNTPMTNIHWKQLVKSFLGNKGIPENCIRVNGLDLYVSGGVEAVVDRPIRPGTSYGLPFGGQCLSTGTMPSRLVIDAEEWPRIRPGEGLVVLRVEDRRKNRSSDIIENGENKDNNSKKVNNTILGGGCPEASSSSSSKSPKSPNNNTTSTPNLIKESTHYFAIGYHRSFGSLVHRVSKIAGNLKNIHGFHDNLAQPLRSIFWCACEELKLVIRDGSLEDLMLEQQEQLANSLGRGSSMNGKDVKNPTSPVSSPSKFNFNTTNGPPKSEAASVKDVESESLTLYYDLEPDSSSKAQVAVSMQQDVKSSKTETSQQQKQDNISKEKESIQKETSASSSSVTQQQQPSQQQQQCFGTLIRLCRPRYLSRQDVECREDWKKCCLKDCIWWSATEEKKGYYTTDGSGHGICIGGSGGGMYSPSPRRMMMYNLNSPNQSVSPLRVQQQQQSVVGGSSGPVVTGTTTTQVQQGSSRNRNLPATNLDNVPVPPPMDNRWFSGQFIDDSNGNDDRSELNTTTTHSEGPLTASNTTQNQNQHLNQLQISGSPMRINASPPANPNNTTSIPSLEDLNGEGEEEEEILAIHSSAHQRSPLHNRDHVREGTSITAGTVTVSVTSQPIITQESQAAVRSNLLPSRMPPLSPNHDSKDSAVVSDEDEDEDLIENHINDNNVQVITNNNPNLQIPHPLNMTHHGNTVNIPRLDSGPSDVDQTPRSNSSSVGATAGQTMSNIGTLSRSASCASSSSSASAGAKSQGATGQGGGMMNIFDFAAVAAGNESNGLVGGSQVSAQNLNEAMPSTAFLNLSPTTTHASARSVPENPTIQVKAKSTPSNRGGDVGLMGLRAGSTTTVINSVRRGNANAKSVSSGPTTGIKNSKIAKRKIVKGKSQAHTNDPGTSCSSGNSSSENTLAILSSALMTAQSGGSSGSSGMNLNFESLESTSGNTSSHGQNDDHGINSGATSSESNSRAHPIIGGSNSGSASTNPKRIFATLKDSTSENGIKKKPKKRSMNNDKEKKSVPEEWEDVTKQVLRQAKSTSTKTNTVDKIKILDHVKNINDQVNKDLINEDDIAEVLDLNSSNSAADNQSNQGSACSGSVAASTATGGDRTTVTSSSSSTGVTVTNNLNANSDIQAKAKASAPEPTSTTTNTSDDHGMITEEDSIPILPSTQNATTSLTEALSAVVQALEDPALIDSTPENSVSQATSPGRQDSNQPVNNSVARTLAASSRLSANMRRLDEMLAVLPRVNNAIAAQAQQGTNNNVRNSPTSPFSLPTSQSQSQSLSESRTAEGVHPAIALGLPYAQDLPSPVDNDPYGQGRNPHRHNLNSNSYNSVSASQSRCQSASRSPKAGVGGHTSNNQKRGKSSPGVPHPAVNEPKNAKSSSSSQQQQLQKKESTSNSTSTNTKQVVYRHTEDDSRSEEVYTSSTSKSSSSDENGVKSVNTEDDDHDSDMSDRWIKNWKNKPVNKQIKELKEEASRSLAVTRDGQGQNNSGESLSIESVNGGPPEQEDSSFSQQILGGNVTGPGNRPSARTAPLGSHTPETGLGPRQNIPSPSDSVGPQSQNNSGTSGTGLGRNSNINNNNSSRGPNLNNNSLNSNSVTVNNNSNNSGLSVNSSSNLNLVHRNTNSSTGGPRMHATTGFAINNTSISPPPSPSNGGPGHASPFGNPFGTNSNSFALPPVTGLDTFKGRRQYEVLKAYTWHPNNIQNLLQASHWESEEVGGGGEGNGNNNGGNSSGNRNSNSGGGGSAGNFYPSGGAVSSGSGNINSNSNNSPSSLQQRGAVTSQQNPQSASVPSSPTNNPALPSTQQRVESVDRTPVTTRSRSPLTKNMLNGPSSKFSVLNSSNADPTVTVTKDVKSPTRNNSSNATSQQPIERIIESSKQARQFEFAPFAPDRIMLVGDKHGYASVIDILDDCRLGKSLFIDANPLLGLSWLGLFPNRALIGAAHSGSICMIKRECSAGTSGMISNLNDHVHSHKSISMDISQRDRERDREPHYRESRDWEDRMESQSSLRGELTLTERDNLLNNEVSKLHLYQPFHQLSSLSSNVTNDYFCASGFTHDIALYDMSRNFPVRTITAAHEHFINISRFSSSHPHIVATAGFDSTVKLWDIRLNTSGGGHGSSSNGNGNGSGNGNGNSSNNTPPSRPCFTWNTGGLNVMCAFSPCDRYLLASGVDTRVQQFRLFGGTSSNGPINSNSSGNGNGNSSNSSSSVRLYQPVQRFQNILREPRFANRYRRSVYFACGTCFVTGATDENFVNVIGVNGEDLGQLSVTKNSQQYFNGSNLYGNGNNNSPGVGPGTDRSVTGGQNTSSSNIWMRGSGGGNSSGDLNNHGTENSNSVSVTSNSGTNLSNSASHSASGGASSSNSVIREGRYRSNLFSHSTGAGNPQGSGTGINLNVNNASGGPSSGPSSNTIIPGSGRRGRNSSSPSSNNNTNRRNRQPLRRGLNQDGIFFPTRVVIENLSNTSFNNQSSTVTGTNFANLPLDHNSAILETHLGLLEEEDDDDDAHVRELEEIGRNPRGFREWSEDEEEEDLDSNIMDSRDIIGNSEDQSGHNVVNNRVTSLNSTGQLPNVNFGNGSRTNNASNSGVSNSSSAVDVGTPSSSSISGSHSGSTQQQVQVQQQEQNASVTSISQQQQITGPQQTQQQLEPYVQSLRTHPTRPNMFAVLLAGHPPGGDSYIALCERP